MSDEKSLADVAQATVDHLANGAEKVAEAIQKIAPGAWHMAVQKQRTEGMVDLAFGGAFVAMAICLYALMWRVTGRCEDEDDKYGFRTLASLVLAGALLIISFAWLRPGLMSALNPEYFAAKEVVAMGLGK